MIFLIGVTVVGIICLAILSIFGIICAEENSRMLTYLLRQQGLSEEEIEKIKEIGK
jgi:hypothetical protein